MPRLPSAQPSAATRGGGILSTLVVVVVSLDAGINLFAPELLRAQLEASGFTVDSAGRTGWIILVCTVLYMLPRTAILGAILITGFLGGAICAHFRLGEIGTVPLLVALGIGAIAWAGLYLRDSRLRQILSFMADASGRGSCGGAQASRAN